MVMDRKRAILNAAAELFREKGFHGVGMDELGARAGITGPAVYRHFSCKDEILAILFEEAIAELLAVVAAELEDSPVELSRLVRHHVDFTLGHRDLLSVYQREDRVLVDPWKSEFYEKRRAYVSAWEEAVRTCYPEAPDGSVAMAVQGSLGLIFSIVNWPRPIRTSHQIGHVVTAMVLEGLASLGPDASASFRV